MATFSKRGKRWQARVFYYDENDKRKSRSKTFDTKKEAQVWAQEIETKINYGDFVDDNISFADYFDLWIDTYIVPTNMAEHSKDRYRTVSKLVREFFGNTPVNKVTPLRYQQFINKRGENRAKDTVQRTHIFARKCLEQAIDDGYITRNPARNAVVTYAKEEREIKAWTVAESEKLAKRLEEQVDLPCTMLYVSLMTGLRIGEVYGLAWKDLSKDYIQVRRNYRYNYNQFSKGKTKAAIRKVPITKQTYRRILEFKLQNPDEYMFLDEHEEPLLSYNSVNKHLKKICRELEIPEYSSHSLRHTFCSLLIYQGVEVSYLSQILGHSTVALTLNTYMHVFEEHQQKEETKVREALVDLQKELN